MRTKEELESEIDDLQSEIDDLRWELKEQRSEVEPSIDHETAVAIMDRFDDFIRRVGISKINIDVVLFRRDLEDLLDV